MKSEQSEGVKAPREIWVVMDVHGTVWDAWHKPEHARQNAEEMDAEKGANAPHSYNRYVLAPNPETLERP